MASTNNVQSLISSFNSGSSQMLGDFTKKMGEQPGKVNQTASNIIIAQSLPKRQWIGSVERVETVAPPQIAVRIRQRVEIVAPQIAVRLYDAAPYDVAPKPYSSMDPAQLQHVFRTFGRIHGNRFEELDPELRRNFHEKIPAERIELIAKEFGIKVAQFHLPPISATLPAYDEEARRRLAEQSVVIRADNEQPNQALTTETLPVYDDPEVHLKLIEQRALDAYANSDIVRGDSIMDLLRIISRPEPYTSPDQCSIELLTVVLRFIPFLDQRYAEFTFNRRPSDLFYFSSDLVFKLLENISASKLEEIVISFCRVNQNRFEVLPKEIRKRFQEKVPDGRIEQIAKELGIPKSKLMQ